ncbi:MAG: hypothetical protein AB7I42_26520 [Bradyrhizobium sp.]|uniref:hypothetical protein n=1 Tax=Bradyrhizobium sp. TaxID=376 RepID=UPI003D105026
MSADAQKDELAQRLSDGWTIVGYSTAMMAAGAMVHSVLLQKGDGLVTATVVVSAGNELGREIVTLAPAPAPKKGWY